MTGHTPLPLDDASQVGAARRTAVEMAAGAGFDAADTGRVALVVTEAASNVVRHGGGGQLLLRRTNGGSPALDVLALDRGAGMANVDRAMEDGRSTAGTPGTGLGALRRLATVFDVYSRAGGGTAVYARVGAAGAHAPAADCGGVSVPMPGEEACGDAWIEERGPQRLTLMVVDGLGHGPLAAAAAAEAVAVFRRLAGWRPAARLEAIHEALRATRGAAVAIAETDEQHGTVRFTGVGNITAAVLADGTLRHLVSHNGIAGHVAPRIVEYVHPWPPEALLVMHSDGLTTLRDLTAYPGLARRHPALIAGVLYRDLRRGRDDATVVVARAAAS